MWKIVWYWQQAVHIALVVITLTHFQGHRRVGKKYLKLYFFIVQVNRLFAFIYYNYLFVHISWRSICFLFFHACLFTNFVSFRFAERNCDTDKDITWTLSALSGRNTKRHFSASSLKGTAHGDWLYVLYRKDIVASSFLLRQPPTPPPSHPDITILVDWLYCTTPSYLLTSPLPRDNLLWYFHHLLF